MLRVGCSKVDITPDFPAFLRGYASRKGLSDGIEDRLSAGVMVLDQDGTRILLLTVDSIGIGIRYCERIYKAIGERFGYGEDRIYLASSHTHFAPGFSGYCVIFPDGELPVGKYPPDDRYYDLFIGRLLSGIAEAEKNLEDTEIEETEIPVPAVPFNRRTIKRSDGMVEMSWLYPDNPDDFEFQKVDPMMTVWRFKTHGVNKAILARFGCHPVTGGFDEYAISADYPGHFQTIVQREFGCPGFFLQGTAGDVVPMQRNGESRRDIAEILVRSIRLAERSFRKIESFKLAAKVVQVPAMLSTTCPREEVETHLAKVFEDNSGDGFDVEKCIKGVYEYENAVAYPQDNTELPLRLMRLGDKVLVGMPFEVLTEIGLRLRKACPNAILTTITGGYEGYLPLAVDYPRGGYETTLGPYFQQGTGDRFLLAAIDAVKAFDKES